MKKIFNILAISSLLLGATACEDWLDMPSESKADSESVFSTLSRADMTVAGCYSGLHSQELGYQLLEGTDECCSKEANSKYDVSNYNYTNLSAVLNNTYVSMYKTIEYANVCIANLSKVPAPTDAERIHANGLMGEALAVRAYAYWNLVRFYGDVPFSTVPTAQLTSFESGRVSRDVIYDQCVADLQKAVELLPWAEASYVSTPERFTKNSAYGILARVALYAAGYSLRWDLDTYDPASLHIARRADQARVRELNSIAANACKAVIDHKGNELVANYEQLFRDLALKQFNKETMLEYGWYGANSIDCRTGYVNGITGSGTSAVIGKVAAQMIANPTLYFDFDPSDQRRDVSVCNYAIILSATADKYKMNTYAGMGVGKYRINWKAERGASDTRRDINWPILRYADVLLMYAEALNELNSKPTAEAADALKQVRLRAFRMDASKVGTIPTDYEGFKAAIMLERKLELSNEGLRRSDLPRWGKQYEMLMANKADLVSLCNREGKYASVAPYRAFKITGTPTLKDPNVALPCIDLTEAEVAAMGVSDADMAKLRVINSGSKGEIKVKFYEVGKNVYYTRAAVPSTVADADVKEVEYTILNMFSINTSLHKGNLSTVKVDGIADKNEWVVGATGIYYGLTKNKTELMPFHQTAVMDVNPGLAGQQHPGYK